MNKIVNGVANGYEFSNLYDPNISYSKAYTEQLLAEKDKEIERLNNKIHDITKTLNETYNNRTELRNENQRLNNIIDEIDNIIRQMIYTGYYVYSKSPYEDFEGQTITNYMATGERSEFGKRALVILDKLKELKEGKE